MKRSKLLLAIAMGMLLTFLFASTVLAAGSSTSTAGTITLGKEYSGSITSSNTADYYKFSVSSSGIITLSSKADIDKLKYQVLGTDGTSLWSKDAERNSTLGVISRSDTLYLTAGTYYFVLTQNSSYTGSYNFTLTYTTDAEESFKETNGGSNNSLDTASSISLGTSYDGMLALNDSVDVYKITLSKSGRINVKITYDGDDGVYYYLYDMDENKLKSCTDYHSSGSYDESLDVLAGTYYIKIQARSNGSSIYTLATSLETTQESFPETESGTGDDTILTANKISMGKTYYGQIAANDWNDFYEFTVSSDMTLYFTATTSGKSNCTIYNSDGTSIGSSTGNWNHVIKVDVTAGTYYVGIVGQYKDTYTPLETYYTGPYSFSVAKYTMATPTLKSVTNVASGITFKWKSVTYADGYTVYRKKSGGSWSKIGTTSETSYTDTTVSSGTTYYYTVAAYNSDLTGKYNSTGLKIKCIARPTVSVENASKGIKVSWKKVSGSSGYYVYRKVSGGSWKKIKTIKKNSTVSYTDKSVTNGKTYYYKVKAYNGSTKSAYSSSKKTVYVSAVSITSAKNTSSKTVTVKWKKNSKATGYIIQRLTKKSATNGKTYTVSSKSTLKKAISSLTKGKTYYFRVRSYKTISGTRYVSAWSSKKAVKITK